MSAWVPDVTGSGPSLATVGREEAAPADVSSEQLGLSGFIFLGGWGSRYTPAYFCIFALPCSEAGREPLLSLVAVADQKEIPGRDSWESEALGKFQMLLSTGRGREESVSGLLLPFPFMVHALALRDTSCTQQAWEHPPCVK